MNSRETVALRLDHQDSETPRRATTLNVKNDARKAPVDLLRNPDGETLDRIQLLGQPSLSSYLRFVRNKVVDGADFDRSELVAEWNKANEYYQTLEESETGVADDIEVFDLDPTLEVMAADVAANPYYQHTYNTFETSIAMVELDRLVLFQTHVSRPGTDKLMARLGKDPSLAELFQFCQPPDIPDAPVKMRRIGSSRYAFTCESTDFRRHKPVLLGPDQIRDHESFGPISGVVGLVVGFGSNFLTGVRQGADGRVLLHNGYHRAYAMRALGITHAPCIIQTVTSPDEIGVVVSEKVLKDTDFYFASARPPMMKDFFDPKIRKVHQIYKMLKMIEIEFEVRDYYVDA